MCFLINKLYIYFFSIIETYIITILFLGWSLDTQNKIIIPAQVEVKETETIPSEQQLQLLTDFVAFLEK